MIKSSTLMTPSSSHSRTATTTTTVLLATITIIHIHTVTVTAAVAAVVRHDTVNITVGANISIGVVYSSVNTWTHPAFNEIEVGIRLARAEMNAANDYTLQIEHVDSAWTDSAGLWGTIRLVDYSVDTDPSLFKGTPVIIAGGNRESPALVAGQAGRTIIDPISVFDTFENTALYPTLTRMAPRSFANSQALMNIISHFGWTNVAIMSSNEPLSLEQVAGITSIATARGVHTTTHYFDVSLPHTLDAAYTAIKKNYVRVVILLAGLLNAKTAFIAARAASVLTIDYTWLSLRDALGGAFSVDTDTRKALDGLLGVTPNLLDNYSPEAAAFRAKVFAAEPSANAYFSWDFCWSWYSATRMAARGLTSLVNLKRACAINNSSSECTTLVTGGDDQALRAFVRSGYAEGVPNNITFNSDGGDSTVLFRMFQMKNLALAPIGTVGPGADGTITLTAAPSWADGSSKTPLDAPQLVVTDLEVTFTAQVVVMVCAAITAVMCMVAVCANIVWRNKRALRASSPNLNLISLFGALLGLAALTQAVESSSTQMCLNRLVMFNVAFTVFFAPLFVKTYRLHVIFHQKAITRAPIVHTSDMALIMRVFMFLAVDAVVIAVFVTVSPLYLTHLDTVSSQSVRYTYIDRVTMCDSDHHTHMIWLMVIPKAILLMVGVWSAWLTRGIRIAIFNDAASVGLTIIVVGFINAVLAVNTAISPQQVTARFIIVGFVVVAQTLVSVVVLVLSKVIKVWWRRRNGGGGGEGTPRVSKSSAWRSSLSSGTTSSKGQSTSMSPPSSRPPTLIIDGPNGSHVSSSTPTASTRGHHVEAWPASLGA